MIPLFLLSIFSVMLVIVYFLTIRRGAVVSSGFMATADALLRKRDYLGLLAVSNRHGEAIARVVQKTLDFTTKNPGARFPTSPRNRGNGRHAGRRESEQSRHVSRGHWNDRSDARIAWHCLRDHSILWCARARIWGRRVTRYSLNGISEALINTAAGLAIGIPAMIFYAFFRGRVQKLISELEAACTHILALLSLQSNRRTERMPALIEDDF